MFKRLADRVSSAVASVVSSSSSSSPSSSSPSPVDTLKSMGFSDADARHALQISGDNVEQAAEWLLTNGTPTMNSAVTNQTEDDDLQKALQESLEEAHHHHHHHRPPQPQSAAAQRSGQAALARFDNNKAIQKPAKMKTKTKTTTSKPTTITAKSNNNDYHKKPAPIIASHPNVQVPKRLSEHDKEDQILRCASRVAPHPVAVDTLLKSLQQLRKNPNEPKFKSIDTSSPAFQRTLNAPGVLDFLKAMNYHVSYSNLNVLQLSLVDPATLYLGISALEQIQNTNQEYKDKKASLEFDKELQTVLELGDSDMQEAIQRSEFLSKCPSEPTRGGGLITVELGSSETKLSRKFDGDDTLQDVIHWLGSHGSVIPQKLLQNDWYLQDRNHSNTPPYNVQELQHKTLQYLGCWPSGRLAIVPLVQHQGDRMPSSSRGLGAAPMDHMHL